MEGLNDSFPNFNKRVKEISRRCKKTEETTSQRDGEPKSIDICFSVEVHLNPRFTVFVKIYEKFFILKKKCETLISF